jgi:Single-strand binding protein family
MARSGWAPNATSTSKEKREHGSGQPHRHHRHLADDPEFRFTQNGIAVANLRVAVTQRTQQEGQWRDGDTSFFKVNVWRGHAEHLADSLTKGTGS